MGNLGTPEIILILLVILIFFGAKKIPEIAQGFGKGIREFRKASRDIQDEFTREVSVTGTAAEVASLKCHFCNSPITKDAKFCPVCGKSLAPAQCSKCGTTNPLGNKFCSQCGEKLS
jgi:sec-independent protein translocase protein TatA